MSEIEGLFAEKDFNDLMYPIYTVDPEVNLVSKFPGLKKLASFNHYADEVLPRNKAIRYIIYCYDRDSPIYQKFRQDDIKRKTTAAHYAGFKVDEDGLFQEEVDLMLKGKNKNINNMIIDYVRQYNDPEYSILVAGLEALYVKLQLVLSPIDSEKRDDFQVEETKGKLFNQASKMGEDIDKLATKILTDENRFLKKDLYCIIDEKTKNRLSITPERMAKID